MITIQNIQPHPRRLIRDKIVALLRAGTDLAGKWHVSRSTVLWEQELPCGMVYFLTESAEDRGTRPKTLTRTLQIGVEVIREMDSEAVAAEDWLDSRAYEIEKALLSSINLDLPFVEDITLTDTTPYTPDSTGDNIYWGIRLAFTVRYTFDAWDESLILDEFLRFDAEYKNENGQKLAEDNVTIRSA